MSTRPTTRPNGATSRGRQGRWWLCAALWLAIPLPCAGQGVTGATDSAPPGEAYAAAHPLGAAGEEAARLLRGDSGLTVVFHPSYRRQITSLTLELVADAGLHDQPDLDIWLNGRPIDGWQPIPGTGPTTLHLLLPQVSLVDGPNQLVVASGSVNLLPEASRLVVRGHWRLLTPHLSMLTDIFDDKLARRESIDILAPGLTPRTDGPEAPTELLRAVSIAVQGAALRMGDHMPSVHFVNAPRPGHDVLIVGTSQDLLPHLSEDELNRITGPRLFLRPDPQSAHRVQLFITGRDDHEVRYAATGFGLLYTPLPDAPGAIIRDLNLPSEPVFVRRAALFPGQQLTLQQLGMPRDGLPLDSNEPAEWTMWLSPRAFATLQPAIEATFRVHAPSRTEPAPAPPAGTLAIDINQRHSTTAGFAGDGTADSLDIPLSALKAGRNRFQFRWHPATEGPAPAQARLGANSTMQTPGQDGDPPPLDLNLLARAAWPLVGQPDGSSFAVALLDRDPAVIQAALLLTAKLAQISNTLLFETEFHHGIPAGDRHVLIFTRLDSTPAEVIDALPDSLARLFGPEPTVDLPAETRLSGQPDGSRTGATIGPVTSIGDNDWLLIAAEPENRGEPSWTLAGTRSPWHATTSMAELLQTDLWNQLQGHVALITPRQPLQAWKLADADPAVPHPTAPAPRATGVDDPTAGLIDEETGEYRDPYLKLPLAGWISTGFWLAAIPVVITFLTVTALSMLNRNPEL